MCHINNSILTYVVFLQFLRNYIQLQNMLGHKIRPIYNMSYMYQGYLYFKEIKLL
jgi:hypothetical protein